jgi:cell wall-associated NlpC family hydrolase
LASLVLSSHSEAARQGLGRAPREPNVPAIWPGAYVPNLSDWLPGDIVLVERHGASGMLIGAGQSITINPLMFRGRNWSHAAIYVGGGMIVDASVGAGIQEQCVWKYCHHRALSLRRLADPSVPSADIAMISKFARSHIGEPYSVLQILLAKLGWPPSSQVPNPAALYCSTFAAMVVAEATTIALAADPKWQPIYPAMLAMHTDLSPVPLEWRNI